MVKRHASLGVLPGKVRVCRTGGELRGEAIARVSEVE